MDDAHARILKSGFQSDFWSLILERLLAAREEAQQSVLHGASDQTTDSVHYHRGGYAHLAKLIGRLELLKTSLEKPTPGGQK